MFEILVTRPKEYGDTKFTTFVDCEKAVLLQSTGLNHKSGVEIFKGDIVVTSRGVGVVEIKVGHAPQVTYKNGNDLLRFALDDLAVIGNIYANPELLEQ